jgi:hypothetical protein
MRLDGPIAEIAPPSEPDPNGASVVKDLRKNRLAKLRINDRAG